MAKHFSPSTLTLAAVLAAAPVPVLAQGYDLPSTPTPSPAPVYGPQDPDTPRARPIPVPTRSATPRPTPTPTPTAARPTQGPVVQPVPSTRPTVRATPRRDVPQTQSTPVPSIDLPREVEPQTDAATPSSDATGPLTLPTTTATAAPQVGPAPIENEGGLPWLWIALGALLAALAGLFLWRRRADERPVVVPEIERPTPAAAPSAVRDVPQPTNVAPIAPSAKADAIDIASGALHMSFEARSITATLMNATLAYRITLSNRGQQELTGIMVGGAMDAANDRVPLERQLEPPAGKLPAAHQIDRLAPGEVTELTGQIVVPLARLAPIRRGEQALFIPIARLRAAAARPDGDPLIAHDSILLGIAGSGPQLGPIRLDLGPRVYSAIGQRRVAPEAA